MAIDTTEHTLTTTATRVTPDTYDSIQVEFLNGQPAEFAVTETTTAPSDDDFIRVNSDLNTILVDTGHYWLRRSSAAIAPPEIKVIAFT